MTSPAKANRERLSFRDRLMRMRKSKDVYPWIAPMKKVWTTGATTVQENRFLYQKQHDIFASELVHLNTYHGQNQPDGTGSAAKAIIPWDVQLMSGTDDRERSSAPVPSEQLLGDAGPAYNSGSTHMGELKRFVTGLRIPPQEIIRILARTYPHAANHIAYPHFFEHVLWLAFRGYQLVGKGSTPTPQLTYSEFAERGYIPEAFNVALTTALADGAAAANEREAKFTIPQAGGIAFHATDFITLKTSALPGFDIGFLSQLMVKLEGFERPIMDDFVPAPLLGSVFQRCAWQFPQPLSVPAGTELKLRVKARTPITWANTSALESGRGPMVSVVLHGHHLVRR